MPILKVKGDPVAKEKGDNFSEEFFLANTLYINLEIFCFEHSGRFFPPPKLFCSPMATPVIRLLYCNIVNLSLTTFNGWERVIDYSFTLLKILNYFGF